MKNVIRTIENENHELIKVRGWLQCLGTPTDVFLQVFFYHGILHYGHRDHNGKVYFSINS